MNNNEQQQEKVTVDPLKAFLALCTDELKPLEDEELKLIATAVSPGTTITDYLALTLPRWRPSFKNNAQAESCVLGQLVASTSHAAALVPRLLATIAQLRPELALCETAAESSKLVEEEIKNLKTAAYGQGEPSSTSS